MLQKKPHKPHLQNPLKSRQIKIKICCLCQWLALELNFDNIIRIDFCPFSEAKWPNFEAKMTKNGNFTDDRISPVMVKPKPLLQEC